MMRPRVLLASLAGPLLVLALLGATPAAAETLAEAHGRALKDYYAGRYDRAVEGLERILAIPVENADLHYNLGCAYFQLHRLGPAIFHFERALALDPGDEDARFNVDTARAQVAAGVKDEIKGAEGDPWWLRVVGLFSGRTWAILFLALWWGTLGILFGLRFLRPGPLRAGLIAGNSLLALLAVLGALALGGRVYAGSRVRLGVVLPDQMAVREGPDPSTKVSFKLHAGLRVRLQAHANGWTRIRLANGLEGWVPERELGVL